MTYPPELSQWRKEVSSNMPCLSKSQAWVLALYSYAVSLTQSSGLSQNAYFLSVLLGRRENSVRQQLREWNYDAERKRGKQRREVDVVMCFAPLLSWVLRLWFPSQPFLTLALDATTLRQTFTVLCMSVVVGHCAIPIAWTILPATTPGKWKPHWLGLLDSVASTLDLPYTVLVLTDRGLYAKWLFERIVRYEWHPLMRINAQGHCCEIDSGRRWDLALLAPLCRGQVWAQQVICFADVRRLRCTLLVMWDATQKEAWLLVTDLPPHAVSPTWYSL
jgi:hypothetical protein